MYNFNNNIDTTNNKKYTWVKFIFAICCALFGLFYSEDITVIAEQIRVIWIMLFIILTFQAMRDLNEKEKEQKEK